MQGSCEKAFKTSTFKTFLKKAKGCREYPATFKPKFD